MKIPFLMDIEYAIRRFRNRILKKIFNGKNIFKKREEYDETFYDVNYKPYNSQTILPLIIQAVNPKSVIDVGCAEGVWLSEVKNFGINDIVGVDGDYVNIERLKIEKENFIPHDLTKELILDRRFDLTISLEVAEHLEEEFAETFVKTLTSFSNVVLFSAAFPGQGGANHVNERYMPYWIKLFDKRGFIPVDYIRPKIHGDEKICSWYRNNCIVFVKEDVIDHYPLLKNEYVDKDKLCKTFNNLIKK